jgi:hypothetical protein
MIRAKPLVALCVALLVLVGLPKSAAATEGWSPSVVLISGPPPLVSTDTVTFEFKAAGGRQGEEQLFLCRLDSKNGLWEACISPVTYTELEDGPHRFEVRTATLGGGDCPEPVPLVVRFTVDTTPPRVAIGAAPSGAISAPEATVEFAAEGATGFECRIDSVAPDAWRPCASPVTYTGLTPGPHVIEVRATDAAGNVSPPAVATFTVASAAPVPEAAAPSVRAGRNEVAAAAIAGDIVPINGVRLEGVPLAGTVRVKGPGASAFRPLTKGEAIAVGSLVDTTAGKVSLTSIDAVGEEQRASFFGAVFRVDQALGTRLVSLELRGGPTGCGAPGAGASAAAAAKSGGGLWGSGKGHFRTAGNFGSATVRGTVWLTAETCSGTFFKVNRGVVAVRDFPRGRTVTLPAGKAYLARDPNA